MKATRPDGSISPRKIVVLLGPTAVGKSDFAVRLAKKFHGVILSADSRQVYRGMNIGTGKITRQEMRGVSHFLLDVASPRGQYTAARYLRDISTVVKRIPKETPLFLVGGTPFYIDIVLHPDRISAVPPNPRLRKALEKKSTAALLSELRRRDSTRYRQIDHQNRRRIIRALEIALGTPVPTKTFPKLQPLQLGLTLPNAQLFKRIDRRVDQRMRAGMLHEVRQLHNRGISWKRLDAFGLEYRFLSRALRGDIALSEAISQLKSAIHHFARRQMTWWKRDQSIHWVSSTRSAEKIVREFLKP